MSENQKPVAWMDKHGELHKYLYPIHSTDTPLYTQPEITVRQREVYGATKYYPECDSAKVFASIAGTTTLTEQTLRRIMKLGYKVKTLQPTNQFTEGEMK